MTNKNLIIIISIIVAGIILLGAGYLAGVFLEKQKVAPQLEQLKKTTETIKELSSKTIASITVVGEVTEISGRTITVTYGTESIDVPIKENVQIYSFGNLTEESVIPKEKIEFGEIKKGDNLNVSISVLPTGELEGVSVIVFPPVMPKIP